MKSNEAERLLKIIADNLEQGKEFVVEQAPDVLQQLILWQRVESLLALCFCICLFLIGTLVFYKNIKIINKADKIDDVASNVIICITSSFISIFSFISIPIAIQTYLVVWIAPKVFIIEYLAKLTNGG